MMQPTTLSDSPLRVIGEGTCGTVFEIPGTTLAYKKGPTENLWTDFCLTNRVYNSIRNVMPLMQQKFPELTVPRTPLCHQFMLPDHGEFWTDQLLQRLPPSHRHKQAIFEVDRIFPLPQATREALISAYFDVDEDSQKSAKRDQKNKDCLVRVYMGERETDEQKKDVYDSLRNFPLRLNMMEDLDYNIEGLAKEMATGLAILHWQAQVNGMDTEFVLGSSAAEGWLKSCFDNLNCTPRNVPKFDFSRRQLHLWMLDFDKAQGIELTAHDVKKQLVPAFLGNDPYYPLPAEEEVWEWFCRMYLAASDAILRNKYGGKDGEILALPRLFLNEVTAVWAANHRGWNPEERILFED